MVLTGQASLLVILPTFTEWLDIYGELKELLSEEICSDHYQAQILTMCSRNNHTHTTSTGMPVWLRILLHITCFSRAGCHLGQISSTTDSHWRRHSNLLFKKQTVQEKERDSPFLYPSSSISFYFDTGSSDIVYVPHKQKEIRKLLSSSYEIVE